MKSRKLLRKDYYLFENHLKRLTAAERMLRFDYDISDEQIQDYIQNINSKDIVVGLFSSNQAVGVAHLSVPDNQCYPEGTIELGISVESEYQNLGLGTDLMQAAISIGDNEGYKKLSFLCQANNIPMKRIADKIGAKFYTKNGHTYACIDLPEVKPVKSSKHTLGLASMRTNVV